MLKPNEPLSMENVIKIVMVNRENQWDRIAIIFQCKHRKTELGGVGPAQLEALCLLQVGWVGGEDFNMDFYRVRNRADSYI